MQAKSIKSSERETFGSRIASALCFDLRTNPLILGHGSYFRGDPDPEDIDLIAVFDEVDEVTVSDVGRIRANAKSMTAELGIPVRVSCLTKREYVSHAFGHSHCVTLLAA